MPAIFVAAILQLVLLAALSRSGRPDPVSYLPVGIAVMGVTMAAMTLISA